MMHLKSTLALKLPVVCCRNLQAARDLEDAEVRSVKGGRFGTVFLAPFRQRFLDNLLGITMMQWVVMGGLDN
jgi:hypothetical protein